MSVTITERSVTITEQDNISTSLKIDTHPHPTPPHTMNTLEGHPAMIRWNKTWKMHHIPQWAKISIRLHAIKTNNWRTHPNCLPNNHAEDHLAHPLFDHYGSIKLPNCQALITQPYGNHDQLAHSFASQLGWSVKCSHPGPWHPKTYYYEFTLKP